MSALTDEQIAQIMGWNFDGPGIHYEDRLRRIRAVADAAIAADRAARAEPVRYWTLIDPVERLIKMDSSDGSLMFFGSQKEAELAANRYGKCAVHPVVYYAAPPAAAATVPEDVAKDAERYRWLKSRMIGVEFDWSEQGITALSFEMPDGCAFGGNCDQNIDSAMLAAAPAPCQEPTT